MEMNVTVGVLLWPQVKSRLNVEKLRGNISGYTSSGWLIKDVFIVGANESFIRWWKLMQAEYGE